MAKHRPVIEAHVGVQSVATDTGKKPKAHDCSGPNAAANAKFNASTRPPALTTDPAALIGAGVIKGN